MTRGRQRVVLVGSRHALALAVQDAQGNARFTRLAERLRAPTEPVSNF